MTHPIPHPIYPLRRIQLCGYNIVRDIVLPPTPNIGCIYYVGLVGWIYVVWWTLHDAGKHE
jgi:hypothetical protein